jgi:hypothetical protein
VDPAFVFCGRDLRAKISTACPEIAYRVRWETSLRVKTISQAGVLIDHLQVLATWDLVTVHTNRADGPLEGWHGKLTISATIALAKETLSLSMALGALSATTSFPILNRDTANKINILDKVKKTHN